MVDLFGGDEPDLSDVDFLIEDEETQEEVLVEASDVTPKSNPDLLGHEAAEKQILEDFNAGRMPHALILAGPAGIGKATFAYRIARFLFSNGARQEAGLFGEPEKPSTLAVKADNPVFKRVVSGGHADLLVVERVYDEKKDRLKNDIAVDDVRRIQPFLRMTAAEGGWRVVIVDSAEYLNRSSQNALLKILEEPPARTMLILTTAQPGAFLPTIRSRCRMVHLEPLSEDVMISLLGKFVPNLGGDEKRTLSRFANGSIGKALQFQKDGGIQLYKDLLKIISVFPQADVLSMHDFADKVAKTELSYETARDILTEWCGRTARYQARGEALPDVVAGDAAVFNKLMQAYPANHFFKSWEKISEIFLQTEYGNLDKKLTIVSALQALAKG